MLIWIWFVALILGSAAASAAADVNTCETESRLSTPPIQLAQAGSPAAKPDDRSLKIVSIDSARGKVMAQSLATGKMIQFTVAPQTLKQHNLRVGQTIGSAFIAANGIRGAGEKPCPCGQHMDGSCACACDVPACVIYCEVGECRGGVKGSGGPTYQTPGGSGGAPAR